MTKRGKAILEKAKPHQNSPPASEPGGPLSPCGRGLRRLTSSLVSRSWVRGSAPSATHHAAFVQMETLRQYNLAQRREDKKKMSARPVIVQSYFGDDAIVTVIPTVIRNISSPTGGGGPSQTVEGHPLVVAISRSCPVETLRQYNLTQRRRERRGAKKRLAQSFIV
jgi:hypothetical protein